MLKSLKRGVLSWVVGLLAIVALLNVASATFIMGYQPKLPGVFRE